MSTRETRNHNRLTVTAILTQTATMRRTKLCVIKDYPNVAKPGGLRDAFKPLSGMFKESSNVSLKGEACSHPYGELGYQNQHDGYRGRSDAVHQSAARPFAAPGNGPCRAVRGYLGSKFRSEEHT